MKTLTVELVLVPCSCTRGQKTQALESCARCNGKGYVAQTTRRELVGVTVEWDRNR